MDMRFTRHQGQTAPEHETMQQIVQYNIDINCVPCPEGQVSQIARQLQTAFPVTSCQSTGTGLTMRMISGYRFAEGALRDFADMVGETLTDLGIAMTMGVVRMVTRQASHHPGVMQRVQDFAATVTGIDWRPVREVPVFYFYKGLRFDRDLSARLKSLNQMEQAGTFK